MQMKEEGNEEMIPKYSQRDVKKILFQISKLSEIEHYGIYRILIQNDINYTHNNNGLFVNMTNVPAKVIKEIENFVNFCVLNNVELDAHEKKLEQCRNQKTFKYICEHNSPKTSVCLDSKSGDEHEQDNPLNMASQEIQDHFHDKAYDQIMTASCNKQVNNLGECENDMSLFNENTIDPLGTFIENQDDGIDENDENDDEHTNKTKMFCNDFKRTKNDWSNLVKTSNLKANHCSGEKIQQFISHLDEHTENIHKKKACSTYMNAKKKFGRKINNDKKQDFNISNYLKEEEYV